MSKQLEELEIKLKAERVILTDSRLLGVEAIEDLETTDNPQPKGAGYVGS